MFQVAPHNGIGGDVSQLLHALLGGPGKYIRNPAVSEAGTFAGGTHQRGFDLSMGRPQEQGHNRRNKNRDHKRQAQS